MTNSNAPNLKIRFDPQPWVRSVYPAPPAHNCLDVTRCRITAAFHLGILAGLIAAAWAWALYLGITQRG